MRLVWLNGALLDAAAARIDPADRGFTLGDGVFETIRASAGTPQYIDQHLARLRHGAGMLGIEVPFSDTMLGEALAGLADGVDCALRLTLTRGPAARGVLPAAPARPTVLVTAGPLPARLPPARVMIARNTRRNEHSPLARIKSLNYLDSILARREAAAAGADDALLLNTQGNLAEASAACVFLMVDGRIVTPLLSDGALAGIGRALLLRDTEATEGCVTQADLGRATAGVLVNALGRRAIASIDGRKLATGSRFY